MIIELSNLIVRWIYSSNESKPPSNLRYIELKSTNYQHFNLKLTGDFSNYDYETILICISGNKKRRTCKVLQLLILIYQY